MSNDSKIVDDKDSKELSQMVEALSLIVAGLSGENTPSTLANLTRTIVWIEIASKKFGVNGKEIETRIVMSMKDFEK